MKTLSIDQADIRGEVTKPGWLDALARRIVLKRLKLLERGRIVLSENGQKRSFGAGDDELVAEVRVIRPAFYSDVAFGGTVGAGEAYIDGHWDSPEVEVLIRVLLQNRGLMNGVDSGFARLAKPLRRLVHRLNRNTRKGSRRNIAAHYDLGNAFYALWLDDSMMYSSAYFDERDDSLDRAALAKLDRICRRLNLRPDDRVVEIGTGWGGFAVHAAKNYGCHVTTTTISEQQYAYASKRIRTEGLEDRITVLKKDYRDLDGEFDKLVSIEMIEAVGHDFLDTFFEKCASLLRPDGQMLLQAITIADQRYEQAKKTVDFIKQYVFPGGFLPSLTALTASMTRATDLRAIHVEDIGLHYAITLRHWRERFYDRLAEIRDQGFSEQFVRLWEFYLCYCEGAFAERAIGDIQLHAIKPGARPGL